MRCRLFYTCRPAGAWVHGIVVFLHTFRISIALVIHSLDCNLQNFAIKKPSFEEKTRFRDA